MTATLAVAAAAAAATPAPGYTAEVEEGALCGSERVAALAVVEDHLSPAGGSTVAAGSAITLSSESSSLLSFAVASSPERLATPDIDSGPGSPSPGSGGTQRYSFTSTKATATPRTVYWQASFSTEDLPSCKHQTAQVVDTAVRTITVHAAPSSEAGAGTNKQQEEEAAAKKEQEEAAANKPPALTAGVSLDATTILVASAREATVKLSCAGTATCKGRLTLMVRRAEGNGKHGRTKAHAIGTAGFSVPAGRTAVVALKLSAAGSALLGADGGRLRAALTILKSSPAPFQTHTEPVHLVRQKHK